MLKYRAERRREHLVTFEDPIEFLFPDNLPSLVTQREMGEDENNFGQALRASLRQAPDVILVGEIRDGETAEIALQAAETGHVVVATLHTNSASQTVSRFLKLIPSERVDTAQETLADILRMIICQRLLADPVQNRRFSIYELLLSTTRLEPHSSRPVQEARSGNRDRMEARPAELERSLEIRMGEGWTPPAAAVQTTGFSPAEVDDFVANQPGPQQPTVRT